jgi:hypothetical protein
MGGGVPLLHGEIARAGQHLAIDDDARAEGVVAARRLRDGHAHEALVVFGRRLRHDRGPCRRRKRHGERAERARDHMAAARTGTMPLYVVCHVCCSSVTFELSGFSARMKLKPRKRRAPLPFDEGGSKNRERFQGGSDHPLGLR